MEGNNRPLWEDDQVITERDLSLMLQGLVYQFTETHWWDWTERFKIRSAIGCIQSMLVWMKNGKPTVRLHQGD